MFSEDCEVVARVRQAGVDVSGTTRGVVKEYNLQRRRRRRRRERRGGGRGGGGEEGEEKEGEEEEEIERDCFV